MADPVSASDVLDALRPIIDPDFQKSIVDLGFIKDLKIEGTRVSFAIELTTPACPVKEEFKRAARERVLALDGVEEADVTMTANTRHAMRAGGTGANEVNLPGVKNIIAVASGKGGVGKSTTAINLALSLRDEGAEVGILDADVYGPSLSLLSGVHGRPDTTADRKIMPLWGQGMKLMSMAFFLNDDSPVIWRGPMVHGLIKQFLTDVEWGRLDYLIVDMPPGTGDAALTLTQMAPLSGAVIVTTANDLSLIDARKGLQMFEKVGVPILGIVENMSYFTPPELPDRKYYLFGQGGGERVASELGVDFLGEVPIDPRIAEDGDAGRPIVESQPDSPTSLAFKQIAGEIARKVAMLAIKNPPVADANITWVGK
ncbi:MAG TPA: iron-sulfur cluster carrier protein ApbC [Deltaproteobacteria bacterium]|nr:iron-sulfur cluster carrier protein ApbC [Deltaproteobacteria bacterium]